MMCKCVNIEIGTYKNQISLVNWWNNKIVCIDKCLEDEIKYLWKNKIITTGCCCGHNKMKSMINTRIEDHKKMVELDYKFWVNKFNIICYEPKF